MALILRNYCRSVYFSRHILKPNQYNRKYALSTIQIYCKPQGNNQGYQLSLGWAIPKASSVGVRNFSNDDTIQKPGLVARFKQMYRDYWYVLVPVHLVTSACWIGGFYYLAKSGIDVIALLKSMGISDRFTDPLKDSSMGYVALAYALYKIATPLRYTVTIGGTTLSIKYLQAWGYIKPIPSREALKEMYQVKKEGLQEIYHETKQELRSRKDQMQQRKDHVMSDIARYKQEMRDIKENELKNK